MTKFSKGPLSTVALIKALGFAMPEHVGTEKTKTIERTRDAVVAALAGEDAILLPRQDVQTFVDMMEMVWKAVPWGKTFNLDVALLNEGELARERIKRLLKQGA